MYNFTDGLTQYEKELKSMMIWIYKRKVTLFSGVINVYAEIQEESLNY